MVCFKQKVSGNHGHDSAFRPKDCVGFEFRVVILKLRFVFRRLRLGLGS